MYAQHQTIKGLAKHTMKPLFHEEKYKKLPLGYLYIVCSKNPNINALRP